MRRILAVVALAAALVVPAPASAAPPGVSVQVGRPVLVGRLFASVPLTVTCQPLPKLGNDTWVDYEDPWISVDLSQRAGRHVASAGYGDWFDATSVCDGKPHTFAVLAAPYDGGVALKQGRAWVRVSVFADYWYDSDDDGGYVEQQADTGWTPVRLRK